MKSRPFYLVAALVFFALAAWELYNDLNGIPRAGFLTRANIVGIVLIPLWLFSGVLLLINRPIWWRPYITTAGILACVMHGAVLRVGRTTLQGYSGGAVFLLAAAALCLIFGPPVRAWLADRDLVSPHVDHHHRAA